MIGSCDPEREGRTAKARLVALTLSLFLVSACSSADEAGDAATGGALGAGVQALVGATIIDGSGSAPVEDGVLLVRDGVLEAVGSSAQVAVPDGADVVELDGRWVVPGFINAHGHVTGDRATALAQLEQYAYYGITTVVSLGEEFEVGQLRDEQSTPSLQRSRVYVSGPVINPATPEEARSEVAMLADRNVDWVKIRVDDGLDTRPKMGPDVYGAVIDAAEEHGLRVAIHVVDLEDAIGVVEAGGSLVAHSVRDQPVDEALADAMLEADVCLVPTLTRELSTYTFAERPEFFDDPFFLERAAPESLEPFMAADFRASQQSEAAEFWKSALPLAMENMKRLHEAGVGVAMGTDTGPFGRFQGYFEHLEMAMMADGGLTPADVIEASTGAAARCTGLAGTVGTLQPGAYADLVVLNSNPLSDVTNTRDIHSVWIAGNQIR